MKIFKHILVGAAFATLAPFASAANLLVNGSFEDTQFTGTFSTIGTGSSALHGWTILNGSVDLINNYWTPSQGHYSIDLSGNTDGTISQTFATVVGQKYTVSFDIAGNPDGPFDPIKYVQVGLSQTPLYTFDTTGKSHNNMGWTTKSFVFQAAGNSSTLFFQGLQDSPYGLALDNVSVTAVPEPETFAMLLAGLGVIGAVARRRRLAAA
jgi:choice-of-anchor C domain-containing protein